MYIKSFLFSVLVGMVACTNTNEVAYIDTTQTQSKPEEVNAYYIPISEARADLEGIKDGNFQYNLRAIINIRK